ncbi:MAG: hypothetical protein ACREA0_09410 [bacterium]
MTEVIADRPLRNFLSQADYWTWPSMTSEMAVVLSSRSLSRMLPIRVTAGDLAEEFVVPETAEDDVVGLISRAQELIGLQSGWDSYGAQRVRREAALHALKVYSFFAREGLPAPALVPTVSGGVQLEWHVGAVDVEVEVRGQGDLHVFYEDESNGEAAEELILGARDYGRLASLAERLINRSAALA